MASTAYSRSTTIPPSVNIYGVPDDYLFSFGLDNLAAADTTKPFFALFLTVSNHEPYYIPPEFRDAGDADWQRAIRYADSAIADFMRDARASRWGRNTLFVLVGDHGAYRDNGYDMCLSHNHVPCFFLWDGHVNPQVYSSVAGQIDVAPTVCGLLGLDYVNTSLGVDLLRSKRRYVHFVSDSHLGCADENFFWCANRVSCHQYLYSIGSPVNVAEADTLRAFRMRTFATSMLKVGNDLFRRSLPSSLPSSD